MSIHSKNHYQKELEKIIYFGGTKKKSAIRNAFYNMLNEYPKQNGHMVVPEVTIKATNSKKNVIPEVTLKDVMRKDWRLPQFVKKYGKKGMTKEAIFHYSYAVLHHLNYRTKNKLNLKKEFPPIPFYENFGQWANWGKALMQLHINYGSIEPFDLLIVQSQVQGTEGNFGKQLKPKFKINKAAGTIEIDEITTLKGIPPMAYEYKLGNRSAIEWILDQYKEKKPKNPFIAEKFNTYRFADYKEQVIDLLARVCTVSLETMKIIKEMDKLDALNPICNVPRGE